MQLGVDVEEAWSSMYLGGRGGALRIEGHRIRVVLQPYETAAVAVRRSADAGRRS